MSCGPWVLVVSPDTRQLHNGGGRVSLRASSFRTGSYAGFTLCWGAASGLRAPVCPHQTLQLLILGHSKTANQNCCRLRVCHRCTLHSRPIHRSRPSSCVGSSFTPPCAMCKNGLQQPEWRVHHPDSTSTQGRVPRLNPALSAGCERGWCPSKVIATPSTTSTGPAPNVDGRD